SIIASACPPALACMLAGGSTDGTLGATFSSVSPPPSPAGGASSISTSLPWPATAFASAGADITSGGIALAVALFITFPANVFNSTFEENYADITAWWEKWLTVFVSRDRRRAWRERWRTARARLLSVLRLAGRSPTKRLERETVAFACVLGLGALLGSLLDPSFGANTHTLLTWLAIALAMAAGVAVSAGVTMGYHRARKRRGIDRKLRALPGGLAIAAACVAISRLSGFQPGYLYGIVCGVSFGRELESHEEGHVVALSSVTRVVLAIVAWLAWAGVGGPRLAGGLLGDLASNFLASFFVSGLVSTVISLFPLRFLPGHKLHNWHKGVWLATFSLTLFVLVQVLLRPHSSSPGGGSHAPLITTLTLFVLFGAGSVLFRRHFVKKHHQEGETSATALEPAPAEGQSEPAKSEGLPAS
ncbi:MAG TPA: FGLLP motif-containing membrane protein, partial [Acidimicrobiales bacterium]|nr:FGLLP motif-containing membrane protein [Acidimicrobiales bacterium]